MKWYRNKEMLNLALKQNNNHLQKTKNEKIKWLLMDYNNLIKDHLELLDENEIKTNKRGVRK